MRAQRSRPMGTYAGHMGARRGSTHTHGYGQGIWFDSWEWFGLIHYALKTGLVHDGHSGTVFRQGTCGCTCSVILSVDRVSGARPPALTICPSEHGGDRNAVSTSKGSSSWFKGMASVCLCRIREGMRSSERFFKTTGHGHGYSISSLVHGASVCVDNQGYVEDLVGWETGWLWTFCEQGWVRGHLLWQFVMWMWWMLCDHRTPGLGQGGSTDRVSKHFSASGTFSGNGFKRMARLGYWGHRILVAHGGTLTQSCVSLATCCAWLFCVVIVWASGHPGWMAPIRRHFSVHVRGRLRIWNWACSAYHGTMRACASLGYRLRWGNGRVTRVADPGSLGLGSLASDSAPPRLVRRSGKVTTPVDAAVRRGVSHSCK